MTGFDRRQYWLLVTLLRTLGSRRELTAQFGMHGPALGILAGLSLLMGGFVSLIILGGQVPASDVLVVCQTMTALVLVPLLVSEAADALLNPAEVSVLAHRPVGDLTYLAAKITYLVGFALLISSALNVLPAFVGIRLDGTAWFYPATHLAAASLGAAFTAIATCGVFGMLFRFVAVSRVRSAALWIQLLAGLVVPLSPHLPRLMNIQPDFDAPAWSAFPLTWFAAIGLAGQPGSLRLSLTHAVPAVVVSALLVILGVQALTRGYMTRVSTAVRSRAGRTTGPGRLAPLLVRTGWSQPSAGAAGFVVRMMQRDWQFRRAIIRASVPLLMLLVAFVGGGLRSPFAGDPGLSTAHLLPYSIAITAITAADFLPFSDHYKARWIFLTIPASGLRGVVRGAFAVLWATGALVPSAVLFVATALLWGMREAALYAAYAAASLSLLVCGFAWLQSGLPFTRQPDPTRAAGNMSLMLGAMVIMLLLAVVQAFFVFPHPARILIVAGLFAAAAWVAARLSLRVLENRVLDQLAEFSSGPGRLFTMVRRDTDL